MVGQQKYWGQDVYEVLVQRILNQYIKVIMESFLADFGPVKPNKDYEDRKATWSQSKYHEHPVFH